MSKENIRFDTYTQDPSVAKDHPDKPELLFSEIELSPFKTILDGPTSTRFAIVDYNGNSEELASPAIWDEEKKKFRRSEAESSHFVDRDVADTLQFHQVNVWALLEDALRFFEEKDGLGRSIPWGFNGNRLIVVPHAGYGKNAYYDRESKSLQFYFYKAANDQAEPEDDQQKSELIYTCLSADIVRHEFGHAVLDGIRPYYYESSSVEATAFHEFLGDITAILLLLNNNEFRRFIADQTQGDIDSAEYLSGIAEQFGQTVQNRQFLRSARADITMYDLEKPENKHKKKSGHFVSQILTGAMFDIIIEISKQYMEKRKKSAKEAFAYTVQRMQRTVIQPLDLLPPVDIKFSDYAKAVLRHEELSNPKDPFGYYEIILEVFRKRGILTDEDAEELLNEDYLFDRNLIDFKYLPSPARITSSKLNTYTFLDDNRDGLGIPKYADIEVPDPYFADKSMRQRYQMPRQYVIQYLWTEEVEMEGKEFETLAGEKLSLRCGGTLVLDYEGKILSWMKKSGTTVEQTITDGEKRVKELLDYTKEIIKDGQVDLSTADDGGIIGSRLAPLKLSKTGNGISFKITPCLHLEEEDDKIGKRQWEISF